MLLNGHILIICLLTLKNEVHGSNDASLRSDNYFTRRSAHLSVGNQQITEVSDHKVLGLTIDNNLTWGPHIRDLCKTTAKKVYQSAKIKHFLNFHARKTFFQAHIQSGIDYASTLWHSASDSLQKKLEVTTQATNQNCSSKTN